MTAQRPIAVLLIIAVIIIAVLCRTPPSVYLYGGQDPGVYANLGNHILRTGSTELVDPLVAELKGSPELFSHYKRHTYKALRQAKDGHWFGSFTPGVYVTDFESGGLTPQFYHLNPLILATGGAIFGREYAGIALILLSLASLVIAALITRSIAGSNSAAIVVAFLFAANPALSYFARFPVSETAAQFFFLVAIYSAIGWRRYPLRSATGVVIALTALCFTRITGFITVPLFLLWVVVGIATYRDKARVNTLWLTFWGIVTGYIASYYYALARSFPYHRDIFRGKLGVEPELLPLIPLFVLAAAIIAALILKFGGDKPIKNILQLPRKYTTTFAVIILLLIFGVIGWRLYQLGFTDELVEHRWFGRRWKIAGKGWSSLRLSSLATLYLMLGGPATALFVYGLFESLRSSSRATRQHFIAFLCLAFLLIICAKQLAVPYLYYFGRYLTSELLPLAIILAGFGWHRLSVNLKLRRDAITTALFIVAATLTVLPATFKHLKETEGVDFFHTLEALKTATGDKGVILIDEESLPEVSLVLPLRLSYGLPTVSVSTGDLETIKKYSELFAERGYEPWLITAKTLEDYKLSSTYPLDINILAPAGSFNLPWRYQHSRYRFNLYATKPVQ